MPLPPVTRTTELDSVLARNPAVAIGVSGGKDSDAAAFAVVQHLDSIGHTGPRILIHSDLGRTEWRESLPQCERLAERLGLELVVVRREKGDMLARWQQRWTDNLERYRNLECVKLILPWSTSGMRFCTSELKTAVIWRELARRFAGQTIVSVVGIRREESVKRAKALPFKAKSKVNGEQLGTRGYDWNAILDWRIEDVMRLHEREGFALHEAYTRYGMSRVSCSFCIMSSRPDLLASSTCTDNHAVYRAMVDLEIESTFAFQDSGWLADVAPQLLSAQQRTDLVSAKRNAAIREAAERTIPAHVLYEQGWPNVIPTRAEAELLADVRRIVARCIGADIGYTDALTVRERYAELMQAAGKEPVEYAGEVLMQAALF